MMNMHLRLWRKLILKKFSVDMMDKEQLESSLKEVKILKMLNHPYIVRQKEAFIDKRFLCIVMDYAQEGDLYSRIQKHKESGKYIPENVIMDWFIQMALALKHIHDKNILHRDLKTQNIFLNKNGQIKLGDFGVSKILLHSYDNAKTGIGTPYYLSPEIVSGRPYNSKSDVWALG